MKKYFLVAVFVLACLSSRAFAHPPNTVGVSYDPLTKTVAATVIHQVSDSQAHYIFKVELLINEKIVKENFFDHQQDLEQQKISYVIQNLNPGDTVAVVASCNVSGKLGGSVVIR